jgi:hypothetical protein
MNAPKEKRRTCYSAPLSNTKRLTDYRPTQSFQDLLARRLDRVGSVAELMPRVLAITFAQGISHSQRSRELAKWNGDKQ